MTDYKVKKVRKRFTVFEVPTKGLWKIRRSFKTKKEANDYIKDMNKGW